GLVSVWGAGAQSQPIVRLSTHVSYSYSYFTLEDHVFEIACNAAIGRAKAPNPRQAENRWAAPKLLDNTMTNMTRSAVSNNPNRKIKVSNNKLLSILGVSVVNSS